MNNLQKVAKWLIKLLCQHTDLTVHFGDDYSSVIVGKEVSITICKEERVFCHIGDEEILEAITTRQAHALGEALLKAGFAEVIVTPIPATNVHETDMIKQTIQVKVITSEKPK